MGRLHQRPLRSGHQSARGRAAGVRPARGIARAARWRDAEVDQRGHFGRTGRGRHRSGPVLHPVGARLRASLAGCSEGLPAGVIGRGASEPAEAAPDARDAGNRRAGPSGSAHRADRHLRDSARPHRHHLSDEPAMGSDRSWSTSGIDEDALAALAEGLPASEVWTLLLEIVDRRAARRAPRDLRAQWAHDRFTQPAAIDPRRMLAIDAVLFEAATSFEALELSPLAPLGVCSRMAPTSQRRVVSALRGTEVVADPTNVLALECARRLKDAPA